MKRALSRTLALIGLGLVTFAITPAHAQTTAPGPYYATPSWDQTLPSANRFIVLSNFSSQAVLDRETGLVWERTPSPFRDDWVGSVHFCLNKQVGGRMGWRLPSINELASLYDPSVPDPGPALPAGHPFAGVQPQVYWSATNSTIPGVIADAAWAVTFQAGLGSPVGNPSKSGELFSWCVRGPAALDSL